MTTPGNQNSITVDTFTVNIYDECSTTLINPADRGDYTTFIYSTAKMPFSFGAQNLDCAAPTYELNLVSSTSSDPTNCWIDDNMNIVMTPNELDDAGMYMLKIDTCVEFLVDGSVPTYDRKCSTPGPFEVTVVDPCLSTTIVSAGFDYVMTKP